MYIHYYVPTTADTLQMWQIENSISFFFSFLFSKKEKKKIFFSECSFFFIWIYRAEKELFFSAKK